MYGILVIDAAGEAVSSVGFEKFSGGSSMLAGLVSAVQLFANKISGTDMSELQFGDMRLLLGRVQERYVVTMHAASDMSAADKNRKVVALLDRNPGLTVSQEMLNAVNGTATIDETESERVRKSAAQFAEVQMSKTKKAASEWSKTVF